MRDDTTDVIRASNDRSDLIRQLQLICDVGVVADITLIERPTTTGVLIGVSSTALILDHWDGQTRRPAGDPFTLDLDSVFEVAIP